MRRILIEPDPILRRPARFVRLPDPGIDRLVEELLEAMHSANGLGLAAPQVGESVQVAVVEVEGKQLLLLNPVLERSFGRQDGWEGCLSVPGFVADVPRPAEVRIRSNDPTGRLVTHRGKGLIARALLHEIDHLAGRLYVDLVDPSDLVDTATHPTPPARARSK